MTKNELRNELRKKLQTLPKERYEQASFLACQHLQKIVSYQVLSFSPLAWEVNLSPLNTLLAAHRNLILPKVEGNNLKLFKVENLQTDLCLSSFPVLEPIPSRCQEIHPASVEIALIPALGFDQHHHRVGSGKGFYDRLLPSLTHAKKWGVGLQEQLLNTLIPIQTHDQKLDQVLVF